MFDFFCEFLFEYFDVSLMFLLLLAMFDMVFGKIVQTKTSIFITK